MEQEKTHYRKAFNSPYLSSADIVEPTVLTIKRVELKGDETKKSKDFFNTAHFVEPEIRQGEKLKPMILNATNSRTMRQLTGSAFIDDWNNIPVTIYVDHSVRFGRDTVEGLRISTEPPRLELPPFDPETEMDRAVAAYRTNGNVNAVRKQRTVTPEQEKQIIEAAESAPQD